MSDRVPNDHAELVARLRAGDEAAFEALVVAYHPQLHAYITRWTGSSAVAADVLQETFLRFWSVRTTVDMPHGVRAYLYAAARGYTLRYFRGERRLAAREAAYATQLHHDAATSWHNDLDRADAAKAARDAVERLPERAREVWRLCREEELTYAEAAAVLGVSVNTVKTQLTRALHAVRAAVAPFLSVLLVLHRG